MWTLISKVIVDITASNILNGVLVTFVIDNCTYMVVFFFMVCFIDFICMVSFLHSTHLSPEFPVCLDNGWLPRPKSSSFSSTTSDRPITSQTCRVGARKRGNCFKYGLQAKSWTLSKTYSKLYVSTPVQTMVQWYLNLTVLQSEWGSSVWSSHDVPQVTRVL